MFCPNSTNHWQFGNLWNENLQRFENDISGCEWSLRNENLVVAHVDNLYVNILDNTFNTLLTS